jgi:hypothetical protein
MLVKFERILECGIKCWTGSWVSYGTEGLFIHYEQKQFGLHSPNASDLVKIDLRLGVEYLVFAVKVKQSKSNFKRGNDLRIGRLCVS